MRPVTLAAIAALCLGLAAPAAVADDDRAPTAEERGRIESVLRDAGYVQWDEIELDDGRWEVDDARKADGSEYDVDLEPGTYRILREDRD